MDGLSPYEVLVNEFLDKCPCPAASVTADLTSQWLALQLLGPRLCLPRPSGKRTSLQPTPRKRNPPWLQRLSGSALRGVSCTLAPALRGASTTISPREKQMRAKRSLEQISARARVCDHMRCPPSAFHFQH